ncbi:MAG: response regulator, partial [Alistipes sp.]|nr:response regulator [Alistipes sp.]
EEAVSRWILVVDDNPDICNFLSQILSTEYQVTSARSGEEAEMLLRNQDFDLVISDIMMPGISGVELCRRIKNDIQVSHVPVILLTARTDVKTKIESLNCGVDAYIEKPFSTDYLKAQVANLFRKYEGMKTVYASTPMSEVRAVTHSELDKEFIEQSREVIIANMSNPDLSVDFLAKEMGMSRTSIFKKLKAITGMTPNDFMKFIRLNEACRLLVEGKYRITEIGFITGFSSSSYFAKCFAKQFGTLPTEFVRNLGQEAEE